MLWRFEPPSTKKLILRASSALSDRPSSHSDIRLRASTLGESFESRGRVALQVVAAVAGHKDGRCTRLSVSSSSPSFVSPSDHASSLNLTGCQDGSEPTLSSLCWASRGVSSGNGSSSSSFSSRLSTLTPSFPFHSRPSFISRRMVSFSGNPSCGTLRFSNLNSSSSLQSPSDSSRRIQIRCRGPSPSSTRTR